jgi:hypothetical protein
MKKIISAIVIAASIALCSCSEQEDTPSPNTQAQVTLNTPEFRVVESFLNAINANDRTAALALVAPNVGYAYSLTGTLNTGVSFLNWLESDLFAPKAVVQMQTATQNGNVVRIQGRWGRNGNASNAADYYFTVENGLITAWRLV